MLFTAYHLEPLLVSFIFISFIANEYLCRYHHQGKKKEDEVRWTAYLPSFCPNDSTCIGTETLAIKFYSTSEEV